MDKITVRYTFDVEITATRDPRDIGSVILDRIKTIPLFTITDARYAVQSGRRQVNEYTGVTAPRRGTLEQNTEEEAQ